MMSVHVAIKTLQQPHPRLFYDITQSNNVHSRRSVSFGTDAVGLRMTSLTANHEGAQVSS